MGSPPVPDDAEVIDALQAEDAEGYSERRWLKFILDSRAAVDEKVWDAKRGVAERQWSEAMAADLVRTAVEQYIRQVRPLIINSDLTTKYWPRMAEEAPEDVVYLGEQYVPGPDRVVQFAGLGSILEADDPMHFEWEEETDSKIQGTQAEVFETTVQIERDILLNARDAVDEFLHELDLGVSVTKQQNTMAFNEVRQDGTADDIEYIPYDEWQEQNEGRGGVADDD